MNVIKRGAVCRESGKHGSGGRDIGTRLPSLITHGARPMSALSLGNTKSTCPTQR